MSKFTKGNWEKNSQGYIGTNLCDPLKWHGICQVLGYGEESEANARLILAAPKLLKALQALDKNGHTEGTWEFAKQAMAEAMGESE